MKKSREETAETRRQIVARAATEFRRNGISGQGIAGVMSSVGLTHGGFYRHFESKEQLVTEAMESAFTNVLDGMEQHCSKAGGDELASVVDAYLSARHKGSFENACPLAALGSDLRRADEETREVASRGIERMVSIVEAQLADVPAAEAHARATGIVSAMVGGMILARITTDSQVSNGILNATRRFILDNSDHE